MAASSSKADIRTIIRAHRASYVDAATGEASTRDGLLFEVFPLACILGLLLTDVKLSVEASVGLLTIAGLLSAFLFAVMLQVSDRAMSWADNDPPQGRATSEHAEYLSELAANAGYASIVSIGAAGLFVISAVSSHHPMILHVTSACGLGLAIHLVLTLLMVMKRVFGLTEQRLIRARTGAASTDRKPHIRRVG